MQLYYIRSPYATCGNCVSWWAVDGHGYTCDLKEAWKVSQSKAESILRDKRGDIAYPIEVVDAISVCHADFQLLKKESELKI